MVGQPRPLWVWIAAPLAILFGVVTIKNGGAVLFFDGAARQSAGNYVPFVLWFNFVAGFAYISTGVGLWTQRAWAAPLSALLAVATLLVFAAFGVFVLAGGAYETRTVAAMALRSSVWVFIAAAASGTAWRPSRGAPG